MGEVRKRPCRFCAAYWAAEGLETLRAVSPAADCGLTHRDDSRVFGLAMSLARVFQGPDPSELEVSYYLKDADRVVDEFDPTSTRWVVREQPWVDGDDERGIEARMLINGQTYAAAAALLDSGGAVVRLGSLRQRRRDRVGAAHV